MIINDEKRFVFVHIPKCAGTSVRVQLRHLDSTGGQFAETQGSIPEIGRVDMAHLPLTALSSYFPETFAKLRRYSSFAILRDPVKRFPSSLFQRIQMFGSKPARELSPREFRLELDDALDFLDNHRNDPWLPYDFIHFQRQHSYVFYDTERVIKNLFTTANMTRFFEDVDGHLGAGTLETEKAAASRIGESGIYRSSAARILGNAAMPLYHAGLSSIVPASTKRLMRRLLMDPTGKRFSQVIESSTIRSFIEDYYSEDIALFHELQCSEANGQFGEH